MVRQTRGSKGGRCLVRYQHFIMLELDHGAAYLILQVSHGFHLPLPLLQTDRTSTCFLLLHALLVTPLCSFLLSCSHLVLASFPPSFLLLYYMFCHLFYFIATFFILCFCDSIIKTNNVCMPPHPFMPVLFCYII
jgi:hypothetical protein